MKKFLGLAAAAALTLGLAADASAIDAIRKVGNARVSGTIKGVTSTEVSVDVQGTPTRVPVNEIESIQFEGEPSEMNLVRSALKSGGDQSALTQLGKIQAGTLTRKEVKQDYEFYAALAQARMALRNAGNMQQAGTAVFNFVTNHKDSYHYFEAVETMGNLLVALNKIDDALGYYGQLEASPFDDLKMRAGVARGKALMQQGKFPEAQAAFEAVLKLPFNPMTQKGTMAESQRFAAVLGRTQCQAQNKEYDAAIKELEENVIANLNPEETALQAQAYVTLGNCYNSKPDGKKAALLAFLHVDVLYAGVPTAHAEALWNLANLWVDLGKNERGQECVNKLNRLYPGSPWITKKRPS
ncbi:MAG: hypothetical protein QM775_09195 [Pirellulales bacterium]